MFCKWKDDDIVVAGVAGGDIISTGEKEGAVRMVAVVVKGLALWSVVVVIVVIAAVP